MGLTKPKIPVRDYRYQLSILTQTVFFGLCVYSHKIFDKSFDSSSALLIKT